ncbi:nitroreductase family protein [Swaminathania salitolerans]|uniref:Nitroreductase n=1 Tax=Swaminathania salitolerans TaxID=182838 RepID=A0A511BNT6_9PROT|nr:nitroreductase family protein [Swaminathania salitolerans]GBQ15100.1 NADH/NADPH-flavin oxidoreductase [Swaminathania salitolerans LMG 21291]GEL01991.1 nitroreductase [Swaminathania salitolerans]
MTDILTAIAERRSAKRFDPSVTIPGHELRAILDAGRHAPTAFNIQHWRFVVVSDPALRKEIRAQAWNQPQVEEASALIVLCADFKAWKKNPGRYWAEAPAKMRETYESMIHSFYEGREQLQRDEGIRSCGIAAYALMLAAAAHGYQSCPMDGFDFEAVGKLINLPPDHEVVMFVAIGKQTGEYPPHGGHLPLDETIIHNRFA